GAAAGFAVLVAGHYALIPHVAHVRSPMKHAGDVWTYCRDANVPVACYPRPVDSVAFYTGRSDFKSYRSKETQILLQHLQDRPRTVVLFSHRHSLKQLRDVLPPHMRMTVERKLGLCDIAVVERAVPVGQASTPSRGPAFD